MALRVNVRLGEPFWRVAGWRRQAVELADGARVDDLLAALGARDPALARELAATPPQIFVGEDAAGPGTELAPEAEVVVLWALAGG